MKRRARSAIGIAIVLAALVFMVFRTARRSPGSAAPGAPTEGVSASPRGEAPLGVPPDPPSEARRDPAPGAPTLQSSRPAEGSAVSGRVIDDLGAPVPEFTIEVQKPGAGGESPWSRMDLGKVTINGHSLADDPAARETWLGLVGGDRGLRQHAFSSPEGTFRIDGLDSGQWQLAASTAPERCSAPLVVDTEEHARDVILVLPRLATVEGFVVDGAGAPVDLCAVDVRPAGQEDIDDPLAEDEPRAHTDSSGHFVVEGVIAGHVRIRVRHEGFCDSEWMEITLAPGERYTDVRIALRSGGRIEGKLDPSLSPLAKRQVDLFSFRGFLGWRKTETDALGRFVIEGVIPQDYVLELRAAGYGLSGFQGEPGIRKRISVREGETTEANFGEARSAIRVEGRIMAAGLPRAGLTVSALSLEGGEDRGKETATDEGGHFELALDAPGRTIFVVGSGDSQVPFERTVPDETIVEFDFELPVGRIAGRVVDSDGKPSRRLPVTVVREEADPASFWSRYARVSTDSDGSFEFEFLAPGTYTLRAPDGEWGNRPRPEYHRGRVLRAGLELLDGGSLLGLELRLGPAGRVSGQVLDASGTPVGGARIALLDGDGRSMSASWETQSDATGSFELLSIAPGTYTISARNDEAQGKSAPCSVEAGRTATVRVVLE